VTLASRAEGEPQAPAGSIPKELAQGETPQETWELNALGLVHSRETRASFLGIPIVRVETWTPVVGKYRYSLSRTDFYVRAGRPDLAARQSARDTTSDALFYGGFLVAVGGIALPLLLQGDHLDDRGVLLGAGVFLGGMVIGNVGAALSGPVVDQAEASVLAQRYNDALQRRVFSRSLPGPRSATSASPGISWTLRF
jgi:hypothetical protein